MSNALEQLAKHFDPAAIERKWYSRWESDGAFDATLKPGAPSFSIQLPPPNITGTLHMGHAFQQTIMDGLTRYHRMRGDNTLWLPGTDHAGIATQLVVERQLEAQGLRRKEMGRPAFVEKVWDWKRQSGGAITEQMRRIGSSVDWKREYFTMDDRMSSVVTSVFVRLYQQGLIYRGTRLVNWDPVLRTAVSDIEVVAEETDGHLWYIQYPLSSGAGTLTVATTRPETLLGDVAVMVHPEDERYAPLLGQTVKLPLCDREIPIIADTAVDKEFGSGVVKVTPAHDFNDYAVGVRHGLPSITILTLDGKISDEAPAAYRGMDRFDARDKIVADLKAQGYLESVKPHKLMVPRGEKSRVVLEPMLTGQWFVAMSTPDETGKSITQKALEVVENGEVQFVPPDWANTYYSWLRNVQDWCISRQLWWGHQIPAWYDEDGNIFVAENEQDAQAQAGGRTLRRDEDVLDTWFSSGLIPFSSLGWPEQTPELDAFLPSSVLVTGYDIIFFWVARMIALTTHFTGKVPFKHVYIHGLIRDAEGGKMSKSEGNVLDPVDLIDGIALEELQQKRTIGLRRPETAPKVIAKTKDEFPDGVPAYGADALRFTFASLASLGRSINFDQKRCEGYRFFCNKLWNATRFVLMQTEGHQVDSAIDLSKDLSFADRWIRSQLQETEKAVTAALDSFRFDLASQAIYEFAWNQYCDWYIELAKVQLQSAEVSDAQKNATRATLLGVLETILRLTHPIMPFITEELWQVVAPLAGRKSTESLMSAVWPTPDASQIDKEADGEVETLKALIVAARSLRSEMGLSPAQKVPLLLEGSPDFERFAPYLVMLARLSSVNVVAQLPDDDAPVAVATQARLMLKIEVDKASERARIAKEIAKATDALDKLVAKLERPGYVDKAPQHLVEKDRAQVDELKGKLGKLEAQATKLA